MIVPCECGAKLKIDDTKISNSGSRIRCPRCSAVLQVKKKPDQTLERRPAALATAQPAPVTPAAIPPAEKMPSPAAPMRVVLIAHDSESVRDMIRALLVEAGFRVETAADGVEALQKATEIMPAAMILDVGLPGIYGFELCERLKGDAQTSAIKIILLTSTYDVARYKREPADLYGADDFIEKHQIPDFLTLKLRKLIYPDQYTAPAQESSPDQHRETPPPDEQAPSGKFEYITRNVLLRTDDPPAPQPAPPSDLPEESGSGAEEHTAAAEPRSWQTDSLKPVQDSSALTPESFSLDSSIFEQRESSVSKVEEADPEAIEKARRLARIIVSDIVLYNEEAAREGIKKGTFYELLKEDIQEGRQLYDKRVPGSIKSKKDFFQEAFDNYLNTQK